MTTQQTGKADIKIFSRANAPTTASNMAANHSRSDASTKPTAWAL